MVLAEAAVVAQVFNGRGSTPPLMPQAIDRQGRHAKLFLFY
jgi:hypothetical protein